MTFQTITTTVLSKDGVVEYHTNVIPSGYFNSLLQNVAWKNDEVVIFGKHITTKRQVAWYGEGDYTYSNTTKKPLAWTLELLELKEIVESLAGTKFNSCLLNLYHDGNEGIAWHSDDEKELGDVIASISLGVARRFLFKHKQTKEAVELMLESGSVLVMKGETQKNWLRSLPKSTRVTEPRINLTFRRIKK
jgi:alkylated DNA repair dioxygenase AlkB